MTQPQRGPVLTAGDSADYGGGGGGGIGGGLGGGPGSRRSGSTANPSANPLTFDTPGTQGSPYAAGQRTLGFGGGGGGGGGEDDMGEGGGTYPTAAAFSADKGSMADVMAHELVVGCLVRLALGAEGETAVEVLQVLGHERGRAHARESLGRGAVGPMEEVVAKVRRREGVRGWRLEVGEEAREIGEAGTHCDICRNRLALDIRVLNLCQD